MGCSREKKKQHAAHKDTNNAEERQSLPTYTGHDRQPNDDEEDANEMRGDGRNGSERDEW